MTALSVLFIVAVLWVVYAFAGHPLALYLLGRLAPRPWKPGSVRPSVSVCVAAYNEATDIARKIDNLLALEYDGELEIVIANDGSSDETARIAADMLGSRGRVISAESNLGKTAMQNFVVPQLRGDIVIFSDATSEWPTDLVSRLVRHFADQDVGCVAADVMFRTAGDAGIVEGQSAYWRYERFLRIQGARAWSNIVVSGTCYAIRRELHRPLPPEIAEDLGTPLQIALSGARVVFDPEAIVIESSATTQAEESAMRRRIALQNITAVATYLPRIWSGNRFAMFQFIGHKVFRAGAFLALAVVFATSVLLAANSALFSLIVLGQVAFYFMAWLASRNADADRIPGWQKIPYYFVLLNTGYARAAVDYVRGSRGATWTTTR